MTPYRPRTAEARLREDRADEWLKSCRLAKGSSGLEDDERTSIGRALRRILGSCSDPVPTLIKFVNFLSAGSAQAPETPPCNRCGGPCPFDTSIPSVRWNAVVRANGWPEYLCLSCIVTAFCKLAVDPNFTATLSGGVFHGTPIEVRFGNHRTVDADALNTENNELRVRIRELELAASSSDEQADKKP